MAFPENFLRELEERNDIADVVSGYVRLTKRSGQNQFGLCPFHSEKTPSFAVNAEKQIYHCFGCGKGGSVINFIMEIENLSFPDAVRHLAKRVNMAIPEEETDGNAKKRERMLALNREAARFFYDALRAPGGKTAQDYLAKRAISAPIAKRFGLGFAPDTWDSLLKAMEQKGYAAMELAEAGLVKSGKNGGFYDAFRNRLMFPIIDVRGSVIGFSGRILGDGEPKYLNSPETLVFSKSRNLFALNLAKKSKNGYIILAEGNIDVVSLHQAGFDSAVASLGTSLTPEQARLISRYTDKVVIAYDSDEAGKKASQRAIGILEKLDLNVRVLRMQGAKDPDEYIKAKGADAFRNLLEKSENHIEYRLQGVTAKYDLAVDEERIAFLREATELVASLPGQVEREVYASRIAEMAKVKEDVVRRETELRRKKRLAAAKRESEKEAIRPLRLAQPDGREIRYANPRSAKAEEGVIRLLVLAPELFGEIKPPSAEDFSSEELGRMYGALMERNRSGAPASMAALSESLSPEEMRLLSRIAGELQDMENAGEALNDYIEILREERRQGEKAGFTDMARTIIDIKRKGYGG